MSDIYPALNFLADLGAALCFSGLAIFAFVYGSLYNWRKTRAGRSNFFLVLSFVLVAGISWAALWIGPDFFLRPPLRLIGWGFATFAVGYILYALYRSWNEKEAFEVPRRDHTGPVPLTDTKEEDHDRH